MFNPVTKVCDWPGVVKYIRPMCDPNHKPPKKRKTELTRVDLIKPTLNELATKKSTTKTVGKLLHARTTTKSTSTTTMTTTTTTTKIVPRKEFVENYFMQEQQLQQQQKGLKYSLSNQSHFEKGHLKTLI